MSTAGSRIISENLHRLVDEGQELQYQSLKKQWTKDIEDSNDLIERIQTKEDYINKHSEEIEEEILILSARLDYYNELGVDLEGFLSSKYGFSEMRRTLERNYRTLSIQFYQNNFKQNKLQYEDSKKNLDTINGQQVEIENKMNSVLDKLKNTDNRIENLGGIFLNIVLTISITSTMVSILVNEKTSYALAIVIGCAWLLLSSIIFISEYYKSPDNKTKNKFATIIYIILTIAMIVTFLFGLYDNEINNKKRVHTNSDNMEIYKVYSVSDKIIIERFIDSFKSEWENNDTNYKIIELDVNSSKVKKIIFYKYKNNNYNYKIVFLDNSYIKFITNQEKLNQWIKDNSIE